MPVKLSIIIPVYRVEATLGRCLESVVGQTFTDTQIILVDDGSPDACPMLCDEWARRDPRISVVHKQNGGLSDARNAGIDIARGEYITFVDSDDFLDTSTYSSVMAEMGDADIVEFPVYRFYGSTRQQMVAFGNVKYVDMRHYWLHGHAYEHCYAWNKIYRRSLFDDVRFPKGIVFEDVATLPSLLSKASKVSTTEKGLYYYCANDKGITATATGRELAQMLDSHIRVMQQWCDDRYYMHVLDIQLDVCRMAGTGAVIKRRCVNPFRRGLSAVQRLKAIIINTLGIKALCYINKKTSQRH